MTCRQADALLELGRRAGNSNPEARKESRPFKVSMNKTHREEKRPTKLKREAEGISIKKVLKIYLRKLNLIPKATGSCLWVTREVMWSAYILIQYFSCCVA